MEHSKVKVVQITPDFPPSCGGIGHYIAYLSKELIRRGHDVSVIFRGKHERESNYNGISVTEFKVPGVVPLNVKLLQNRLEAILDSKKIDLVHIHYGAMPVIKCGVPIVVTAHWCNAEGIPVFHRPIRNLDALYRNLMLPIYKKIEDKTVSSCDKLTVVSESLRIEFQKYYKVNSDVVYNGVDTQFFFRDNSIEKDEAIIFTGSLSAGKGVLDLLKVAKLLKQSHGNVRLYIVGEGPLRTRVADHLKKEKLSNVILINHLSHTQLIDYYNKARIYVFPTYYEGLPTTILEAMACELPVVASNVSGIPEQIEQGVNGYMLSPGDIKGFYNRIAELLDDRDKQMRFGKMGKRKVLEKFTWSHVASRVEKIYNEILRR